MAYQTPVMTLSRVMDPEQNSFGVVRLAMALLVVVSHSYTFVTGSGTNDPIFAWTGHTLGQHGVQVFFILSGILVTESLLRSGSTLDFATARLLRIFPGLIVCVLLTALALGPMVSHLKLAEYLRHPDLAGYIVRTLTLTTGAASLPETFANLPAARQVNISLWTLKYEVLCYLALAVAGALGLFHPRWRKVTAALLAVFLALVFLEKADGAENTQFENVRYFALYFGTGVLAALLKDKLPIYGLGVFVLSCVYALSLATPLAELTCALALGYATIWTGAQDFGPLKRFCQRADLSFGVYIYSAPIQQTLLWAFPLLTVLQLTVLAILLSLPLAAFSWFLVEKPALGLRRYFRKAPATAPAARPVSATG